jgi:hypothetical protein
MVFRVSRREFIDGLALGAAGLAVGTRANGMMPSPTGSKGHGSAHRVPR